MIRRIFVYLAGAACSLTFLFGHSSSEARVFSNTMKSMPDNAYLADTNGDSVDEWVVTQGRDVYIARTNFQANGYAYHRLPANAKRAFAGRWNGTDKEGLCFILSNGQLRCYGLSPDTKELWWAWSQGSFISDSEHAIVGDYTGDGKDDVLVYDPGRGTFEMWTLGSQGWFVRLGDSQFDIGNLRDANSFKNQIILSGNFANFGREGTRTDLLIYNPRNRQLRRYDARRNREGRTTFWWAFTTRANVVNQNEDVAVANVDGGSFENVVLHDQNSGNFRFFRFDYGNSNMVPINQIPGQLRRERNDRVYWGDIKATTSEPGGSNNRDDALIYIPNWRMYTAVAARWDRNASRKTYWWAYTQHALRLEQDQDLDGIKTKFELGGFNPNGDARSDEPLHHYGASPFVKDIFVEVDYMLRASPRKDLSMALEAQNLSVQEMASKGINLHIFQDDSIAYVDNLGNDTGFNWERDFDPIKNANFTRTRWPFFHYAVFGNGYDNGTSSGLSRGIGGSDFIVTLGKWGTPGGTVEQQAGTFLHELGHNINFVHGGADHENFKPNHLSIMNYSYQTSGIEKDSERRFLYSEFPCEDLDENNLNENLGVQCDADGDRYRTLIAARRAWVHLNRPVQFDDDPDFDTNVRADLNNDGGFNVLVGAPNEYQRMRLQVGLIGNENAGPGVGEAGIGPSVAGQDEELTYEQELQFARLRPELAPLPLGSYRSPHAEFQVLSGDAVLRGTEVDDRIRLNKAQFDDLLTPMIPNDLFRVVEAPDGEQGSISVRQLRAPSLPTDLRLQRNAPVELLDNTSDPAAAEFLSETEADQ